MECGSKIVSHGISTGSIGVNAVGVRDGPTTGFYHAAPVFSRCTVTNIVCVSLRYRDHAGDFCIWKFGM